MVSSGQVAGSWNSLQTILITYGSEITAMSQNWKGPSFDALDTQSQTFLSDYSDAIGTEMAAFANACDLYEQYKIAKGNLEITKNNYNTAVANKDSSKAAEYQSQITQLTTQCSTLKSQITTNLSTAGSQKLTATSGTYSVSTTYGKSSSSENDTANATGNNTTSTGSGSGNAGGSAATYTAGGVAGSAVAGYSGGSSGYTSGGSSSSTAGSSTASSTVSSTGTISVPKVEDVDYSNLNMSNYPTGSSQEDGMVRGVLVAKYLVEHGGFTKEQAAALVGVYVDENNCDPGSYMEEEKNGQGASGTGGNGYGAGIGSWTFEDYKNQCLNDAGYPSGTPIESLTLQQQCDMIIATSQKSNKKYYDALKRCETIEDASATAVVMTGGVGFSSNWDTHPTAAEAKAMSDYYGRANDARFGASEYHWNADQRRLAIAKEIYNAL